MTEAPLTRYLALIETQRSDPAALSYDVSPFFGLDTDDRTTALARLLELARQGDTRAIATLGRTGDRRAIAQLEHLANTASVAATAQRALLILRCEPGDVLGLAAQLDGPDALGRTLAAAALREALEPPLGTPERRTRLRPLIASALLSPHEAIRHHAGRAVAAALGLDPDTLQRQHPLRVLLLSLSSQLPTLRLAARESLLDLFDGGEAPTYRGTDDPSVTRAFWDGLRPPTPRPEGWTPYRLDLIFAMSDDDRAWVNALVLSRLAAGDLFAADASAKLLGAAAKPHLEATLVLHADRADVVSKARSVLDGLVAGSV